MPFTSPTRPIIRRGRESELPLVDHLYRASLLCLLAREAADGMAGFGRASALPADIVPLGGGFFVAEENGALIGGLGWRPNAGPGTDPLIAQRGSRAFGPDVVRSAVVLGFFVVPDQGATAVARRLMTWLEVDAGRAGFNRVVAVVHPLMADIHSEIGFCVERVVRWDKVSGRSLSLLQMHKRIPATIPAAA
ncbi:hypothetical protein ACUN0C_02330 [Faunimonas sp. B44]|uniref:hypothetical protein n=1 Tax=Faunimonas sp. B44 TaxID=3461493 RepID=UPI004044422D